MGVPNFLTITEQVVEHLRGEIIRGRWIGIMPGMNSLAPELEVNAKTVELALRQLEKEGVLVSQGRGRRRKIVLPKKRARQHLRVAILLYEKSDQSLDYLIDCKNNLELAGHTAFYVPINLTEIKMDVRRLARMVRKTEADAWVVVSGTSEILQWFIQQKIPAFALFGRWRQLNIAGIGLEAIPPIVEATRRLIDFGHQRIVLLDSIFDVSKPGTTGKAFLDTLSAGGIATGSYNLPGWEDGLEGLNRLLDSSFQLTPPTAIIIGSGPTYIATLHFLLNRGIKVPKDLSLIVTAEDPGFYLCEPSVSHIRWKNSHLIVNRIVRWVSNISEGKEDTRQTMIEAEFFEGGTIGPVVAEF